MFERIEEKYETKVNKNGITVILSDEITLTVTKNPKEKQYGNSTIGMRHSTIEKKDQYIKSVTDKKVEDLVLEFATRIETGLKFGATPNELLLDIKSDYPKLERNDVDIEILKSRLDNMIKEILDIRKEMEML